MELKKNQSVQLEILGYTAEGNGVGRYHEIAVFVPGAARGDLLQVKILKTAKRKNTKAVSGTDSRGLSAVFKMRGLCVPPYPV